ncbi:unnamed protein product, partial [Iphiclides podalirius]
MRALRKQSESARQRRNELASFNFAISRHGTRDPPTICHALGPQATLVYNPTAPQALTSRDESYRALCADLAVSCTAKGVI